MSWPIVQSFRCTYTDSSSVRVWKMSWTTSTGILWTTGAAISVSRHEARTARTEELTGEGWELPPNTKVCLSTRIDRSGRHTSTFKERHVHSAGSARKTTQLVRTTKRHWKSGENSPG